MEAIKPIYNFDIQENGDTTIFNYNKSMLSYKAVAPLCLQMGFFSIFITGFLLQAMELKSIGGIIFLWVFLTVGLGFAFVAIMNAMKSKSGTFTLKGNTILIDGKTYDLNHIKTFSIKDPDGGYTEQNYIYTTDLSGSSRNVARQIGNNLRKHIKQTQYKVVARYATKDITIAKGLSEVDAEMLFEQVTQRTGYTKSV